MRNVADRNGTEGNDALPALFCLNGRDPGRRRKYRMPEDHRRNVQKMGKQHAGKSVLADQRDRILISLFAAVQIAVAHITVGSQQSVQAAMTQS